MKPKGFELNIEGKTIEIFHKDDVVEAVQEILEESEKAFHPDTGKVVGRKMIPHESWRNAEYDKWIESGGTARLYLKNGREVDVDYQNTELLRICHPSQEGSYDVCDVTRDGWEEEMLCFDPVPAWKEHLSFKANVYPEDVKDLEYI